jgi:molybdate transport system regulatory protein
MPKPANELRPRLRFPGSSAIAFGPGKAVLLRHIGETGSITKSAIRMGMSYNRAWILVRDMNRLFRKPLVARLRGGSTGGGSSLTAAGADILARYERMEEACLRATRRDWNAVRSALRR